MLRGSRRSAPLIVVLHVDVRLFGHILGKLCKSLGLSIVGPHDWKLGRDMDGTKRHVGWAGTGVVARYFGATGQLVGVLLQRG